jgi:hypothetical protein
MKINSVAQRLIADNWHFKIYMWGSITITEVVYFSFILIPIDQSSLSLGVNLLAWIACPLLIVPITYLISGILGVLIFPTIHHAVTRINGGPFKIGDDVEILSSRLNGKTGRIYQLWQNNSFRVFIGDDYKKNLDDIFDGSMVKRIDKI